MAAATSARSSRGSTGAQGASGAERTKGAKSGKGIKRIKRSRTRRAGESAYGLLLVGKNVLMTAITLLILAGGVWASWGTAQHAMLTKGRERGTMTLAHCGNETCTGRFAPADASGLPRPKVTVDKPVSAEVGEKLAVVVKPGSDEVVRTGLGGILHAWTPFAGSLLLAALVVAGGLRMRRTGWLLGLLGIGLLAGSFATM